MKHLTANLLLTLLLTLSTQNIFGLPNKKALIIGIGAYKTGLGWQTLHGDNDADVMRSSLLKTGFEELNIHGLKNNNATKQEITNSMDALLNECRPGDIIVFHFSGHGQQIQDMNGDEADGYDEALIPYDAPSSKITASYNGNLHLTDDEIGIWCDRVRSKIGGSGQLILFIDACHSGTVARGNAIIRGGVPPLMLSPSTFKQAFKQSDRNESGYFQQAGTEKESNKGKFVLFAAARSDKPDYEYQNKMGSLTYALTDALDNKIQSPNTSFRDLYEYVRNTMAIIVPSQNPELEGDKDVTIFSGGLVVQDPYFYVQKVRGSREITISGGTVLNVNKNAVIGFYSAGTKSRKNAKPLVTGKVVKAGALEAVVLLDNTYDPDSIEQSRAMVIQEGNRDRRTKIFVSSTLSLQYKQRLTDTLSSIKQLEICNTKNEADIIVTDSVINNAAVLRIMSANESTDLVNPVNLEEPARIYKCNGDERTLNAFVYTVSMVKNYAVNSILKTTDFTSAEYSIKIELLPAELDENGRVIKILADTDNTPSVGRYSHSCVRLTNNGNTGGFVTLIEFNPGGTICPIIGVDQNVKLEAGQSYNLGVDEFSPPYGKYILKGFITANPIGNELNLVINQQGGIRGSNNEIATILSDMLDDPVSARTPQNSQVSGASVSYSYELLQEQE